VFEVVRGLGSELYIELCSGSGDGLGSELYIVVLGVVHSCAQGIE
jgi:hypothetical protein